ncbi:inositol-phosphate transport system permease protein [Martelella mangrovi]|uniref:Inositol-phosphate transport system permease protein n=2 Tax=Martelella mangrovi TaxID=1397477 RepID=A0ABV2I7S3_9HYPH
MADNASRKRDNRPGALTRSAGTAAPSDQRERRSRVSPLGTLMLTPTLIFVGIFFLAPIVLTAIFSFTNMTSSTGISGGAYVITPNGLRELAADGIDPAVVAELARSTVVVDKESLAAARAAGVDAGFLDEIEEQLSGQQFVDERAFERELKTLPGRPRRIRELKLAAEPFSRSILNTRFQTRDEASRAITTLAPEIDPADLDRIVNASYTGWVWTTANFEKLKNERETVRVLLNTAFYVSVTLAFSVFFALYLAFAIFYMPPRMGLFFSALWLLPKITPVVLYTLMWKAFTWDNGLVATLAEQFGLPSFNYMKGSVPSAWTIVILVNGFIGVSLGMILFSSALRAIPMQQLWASEVDGASRWQQVRYILLPQMRWPIMFYTCYQTLSLIGSYEQIWLTTNGGPGNTTTVWSLEAFRTALFNYSGNLQYGLGAAMALVLVTGGLVLSITFLRIFRFRELVQKPKIEA